MVIIEQNCIINYSEGHWYPRGQARLIVSLRSNDTHFNGDLLFFNKALADKCPTHQESPYAFKYWAFNYALEKGYKNILWLDSSFWAIKKLDKLFEEINNVGYVFQESQGYTLGEWCSDNALKTLQFSREEAFKLIMIDGGFLGLNVENKKTIEFLIQMTKYSLDNKTFQGDWKNDKQQVSKDKRVSGHRHDMSVATMVINKLKMNIVSRGKYWIQVAEHKKFPNICLLGQGM